MSIEKPNLSDWRYRQLVRVVNYPCVKMITTRDGLSGLDRLKKYYIKKMDILMDCVGDPALWAPQCYGIEKEKTHSPLRIGVGLVRTDIYEDYKGGISASQVEDMYRGLISRLIKDNSCDFYLFCNGMETDIKFGRQLLNEYHLPQSKLLKKPSSAEDLLEMISTFDIVFGARLHACISSVALNIPVSGLLWDDKLDFFSDTMGIRDLFVDSNEFSPETVYLKLKRAFSYPVDNRRIDDYKNKTRDWINRFVSS